MNDNVQNGEVIIDINDLSKAFGDLKVLTNISTQIRKVVEDHRQRQINSSHDQKRCPRVIRSGTDDITALRQILHRHVTGYRSLFQKNNKLIAERRKYVFNACGIII